jgi:hypothetical protein
MLPLASNTIPSEIAMFQRHHQPLLGLNTHIILFILFTGDDAEITWYIHFNFPHNQIHNQPHFLPFTHRWFLQ